jgi:uncharacterized lipoprotein
VKNVFKLTLLGLLVATLNACGGADLTCDDVQNYQLAEEGKRVEAPEGLDDLDPLEEMVLPKASPRATRPEGSDCFDRPPAIDLES